MPRTKAADLNDDLLEPVASTPGRTRIIIEEDDNAADVPVFVSVNGYAYQIKRGTEVEVPDEVLHVLDNAIESRLVQIKDGEYRTKSYLRFPYRVVR